MKRAFAWALVLAVLPATVRAQGADPGRFHIAATLGTTEYDLAGVGDAAVYSARAGVRLNHFLGFEAHAGYASLDPDRGDAALYFPEVHVQARWPGLRISPYIGLSAGVIVADARDPAIATDSDATFSVAAGVTGDLARRMFLLSEARVRGVTRRFTGSTGDLNVGLGYRF